MFGPVVMFHYPVFLKEITYSTPTYQVVIVFHTNAQTATNSCMKKMYLHFYPRIFAV